MSDFCHDCTERQGHPGDQNDFFGFPGWQLCEGCGGYIYVNKEGKKVVEPAVTDVKAEVEKIEMMGVEIPFYYYQLPWYLRALTRMEMMWWRLKNVFRDVFSAIWDKELK